MELQKIIEKLHKERAKLDDIIASLEHLQRTKIEAKKLVPKKRGRKFMDEAARREVSARMKKYWAARRSRLNDTGPSPLRAIQ